MFYDLPGFLRTGNKNLYYFDEDLIIIPSFEKRMALFI